MNKDVIYIDIEDDITAIIGKVKSAGSKIVALVPPKRAGVLQSAVNLKLLQKAADTSDKRVVLITNDHSLTTLAAGVKMPVAKNLQSRPEVPVSDAPAADEEEVINGADLPVGDMAAAMGTSPTMPPPTLADKVSNHVDLRDAPKAKEVVATTGASAPKTDVSKKPPLSLGGMSKKLKIPDFKTFRNKLFLFGGIGVVVIAFLVWALVFAPHASINISAETIAVNIDKTLTMDPKAAASDAGQLTIKPNVQQLKKSVATTFAATGQKDIGNKASGTINITNCDSPGSFNIPAGSTFTSASGHKFTNNAVITVPGFTSASSSICNNSGAGAGRVSAQVTAADLGDEYNIQPTSFTTNVPFQIAIASSAPMTGGSHQMATVVSQEDVDKAKTQLAQPDVSGAKNELKKQFVGDFIVIEESFTSESGQPAIEPAVGQPAQQAKLTVETTYTYVALARNDIKAVAQSVVDEALKGKSDQQLYSLGDNNVSFQVFQKLDNGTYTARLGMTAAIGPKIDTNDLAKKITGKRFGEIQTLINQIQGVQKVDINMSPFWVNTAPAPDKIDIRFSVANGQ